MTRHRYAVAREVEDLAAVVAAAGSPAALFGMSSGAALALEAVAGGVVVEKLALYEPPFDVDPADPQEQAAYVGRLDELLAAGQRGDAVDWFLANAGVPAEQLAVMHSSPNGRDSRPWRRRSPTTTRSSATAPSRPSARHGCRVPTLVANGGSPSSSRAPAAATAAAIPGAEHRVLEGQAWGQVDPEALARMLAAFFADRRPIIARWPASNGRPPRTCCGTSAAPTASRTAPRARACCSSTSRATARRILDLGTGDGRLLALLGRRPRRAAASASTSRS